MTNEDAKKVSLDVIEHSKIAYLSTVDERGFPNVKAMLNLYHDDLHTFCFSTSTSSKRVKQILHNDKASIYFCDNEKFLGLMLIGNIIVSKDEILKKKLWFDGSELFYPLGITDPDYSVLKFTTLKCDLYTGKEIIQFGIN